MSLNERKRALKAKTRAGVGRPTLAHLKRLREALNKLNVDDSLRLRPASLLDVTGRTDSTAVSHKIVDNFSVGKPE